MIDRQLGDAESKVMRKHRYEAMSLAVEPDMLEDLGTVCLETAVHVMKLHPGRDTSRAVVDPRHEAAKERILAVALPARDDVVALVELCNQIRNLCRVVLKVGVHRHDDLAGCNFDACSERSCLSEVPAQAHDPHVELRLVKADELLIGAVGRAVVDEDDLPVELLRTRARLD